MLVFTFGAIITAVLAAQPASRGLFRMMNTNATADVNTNADAGASTTAGTTPGTARPQTVNHWERSAQALQNLNFQGSTPVASSSSPSRVVHSVDLPNANARAMVPKKINTNHLVQPKTPSAMKRMMKNQFDDYANYVGNSKKIAASKAANKLAEQVDNTEKIRAELMHKDRAAKEKLKEIEEYIEETMSEHIEIVKNEANVQKQAIKNAQRDFIENCNVIKTNAQKRHDASTCANCISFETGIRAYETLLSDKDLLKATVNCVETFRLLAVKSLDIEREHGSQTTPFTDLQNEMSGQQVSYLIDRPRETLKKSTYDASVLSDISLNMMPYPSRADVGSDTSILMSRVIGKINAAVDEFQDLSADKKTITKTSEAVLQQGMPFMDIDTRRITDSVPGSEDSSRLLQAATKIGAGALRSMGAGNPAALILAGGSELMALTKTEKLSPSRMAQASNIAVDFCSAANHNYDLVRESAQAALAKISDIKRVISQIKVTQVNENQIRSLKMVAQGSHEILISNYNRAKDACDACYKETVQAVNRHEAKESCSIDLHFRLESSRRKLEKQIRDKVNTVVKVKGSKRQQLMVLRKKHNDSVEVLEEILSDRLHTALSGDLSDLLGDRKVHANIHEWLRLQQKMSNEYLINLNGGPLVNEVTRTRFRNYILPALLLVLFVMFESSV